MKLSKTHLFFILIVVLVASTLGFSVKEYFENNNRIPPTEETSLSKGSNYDPFGNTAESRTSTSNGLQLYIF